MAEALWHGIKYLFFHNGTVHLKAFSRKFCFLKLGKICLVAAEKQNFILQNFMLRTAAQPFGGRGVALTAAFGPCR